MRGVKLWYGLKSLVLQKRQQTLTLGILSEAFVRAATNARPVCVCFPISSLVASRVGVLGETRVVPSSNPSRVRDRPPMPLSGQALIDNNRGGCSL